MESHQNIKYMRKPSRDHTDRKRDVLTGNA